MTPQVNLNSSPPDGSLLFQSASRLRFYPSETGRILNHENLWLSPEEPFNRGLIVGTGKYKDGAETQAAIEASGAEMVTVAVRRGQSRPVE